MAGTTGKNYRISDEVVDILKAYVDDLKKDTPSMKPGIVTTAALIGFFDLPGVEQEDLICRVMFFGRRRRRKDSQLGTSDDAESDESGSATAAASSKPDASRKHQKNKATSKKSGARPLDAIEAERN